jgi:AcrR family transcriptional regulator
VLATRKRRKSEWEALCRRGIQDAVVRILSRDGAQALTMERVAAEAGVAKGTLYLYFRDKKQLLASVKEESLSPMREELFAILDGQLPAREKLQQFVSRHLGYFDEHRDFFRVLLWDRQLAETTLRRQQSARFRAYMDKLAGAFREGSQAGVFRPLDPFKLAAMLIEADVAMIAQRLLQEAPAPVEEDARMLLDVFLNGISTRRVGAGRRT